MYIHIHTICTHIKNLCTFFLNFILFIFLSFSCLQYFHTRSHLYYILSAYILKCISSFANSAFLSVIVFINKELHPRSLNFLTWIFFFLSLQNSILNSWIIFIYLNKSPMNLLLFFFLLFKLNILSRDKNNDKNKKRNW